MVTVEELVDFPPEKRWKSKGWAARLFRDRTVLWLTVELSQSESSHNTNNCCESLEIGTSLCHQAKTTAADFDVTLKVKLLVIMWQWHKKCQGRIAITRKFQPLKALLILGSTKAMVEVEDIGLFLSDFPLALGCQAKFMLTFLLPYMVQSRVWSFVHQLFSFLHCNPR